MLEDFGRAAAMQTGALVKGASSLVAMPSDVIVRLLNAAGITDWTPAADQINSAVDSVTPEARNSTERVTNSVVQALGGAAGGVGLGRAAVGTAANVLAANPGMQAAGAVGGGGASQIAAESGAGPVGQTVAGLAGGVAGSAGVSGLAAATRGAFRGGEAGRQRMAENIKAFEDAGTTASVGQATERRSMQAAESLMSKTPGSAGRMAGKAEAQAVELGAGVEKQAGQLASKTSAEQAGRAIERGVRGEGGFVEQFKAKQAELYNELDPHVQPQTPVELKNTTEALAQLNAAIPGAPNVSKFFQNSKMKGIEDALQKDLSQPTDASKALDDAMNKLEALQQSRDSAAQQARGFRDFAKDQAGRAKQFFPVKGMPRIPGRQSNFPDRAAEARGAATDATSVAQARSMEAGDIYKTLGELQSAVAALGGKLPYEAIKKLRTLVGNEMADSTILSDVPRSKWKALYAALSTDIEGAATVAGPKATAAWNRANNFTRAGMRRLEAIDHVIEKNGGPEAVFAAATSGTKEGATTLRAVMQSLPGDAQKTVSATVLRRLGRATPGRQNDLGEKFSTETFLTNWNSMSPAAKAVLFDRYGEKFRQNMDQIAKVASNLRDGSQVFRNSSGTGPATAQMSAVIGFVAALASGSLETAGLIAGGVASANLSARLMTNPRFVKWLATSTKAPAGTAPALLNQLAQDKDPDIQEFVALAQNQPADNGQQRKRQ